MICESNFWVFPVHLRSSLAFIFIWSCIIFACFPSLLKLSSRNPKKAFLKNQTSRHIEDFCKGFSMRFLGLNDFLRNYSILPRKLNKILWKSFLGNKRKIFNAISETKSNTVHYFTVFATTKPRSEPAVVARLELPDSVELEFVHFV